MKKYADYLLAAGYSPRYIKDLKSGKRDQIDPETRARINKEWAHPYGKRAWTTPGKKKKKADGDKL